MKRLLLLVLCLSGCVQHPTKEELAVLEQQLLQCQSEGVDLNNEGAARLCIIVKQTPVLAYFVEQCKGEGIGVNDPGMRGCVTTKAIRADAEYRSGRQPPTNVLIEAGRVLSTPMPQTQRCSTRPDYAGGWTTACY